MKICLKFCTPFPFCLPCLSAWSDRKVENIETARGSAKAKNNLQVQFKSKCQRFFKENIPKSVNTKKSSNFKFEVERQYFSDNVEDHKEKIWKVKFKTPLFWRTLCVDYFGRHFVLFHVIIEAGMYNEYSLSDSI